MTYPVKVYFERKDGSDKVLSAKDQAELDGLLRIGWKVKDGNS